MRKRVISILFLVLLIMSSVAPFVGGETGKIKFNKKNGVDSEISTWSGTLEISKWDNEAKMSLKTFERPTRVDSVDGKHTLKLSNYDVRIYELGNGIEYEIIVYKEPADNRFFIPIDSTNLEFYYQAPLTEEDIAMGLIAPEETIGAYAIYHSNNEGGKYETGKFGYIYRPLAIDANGDSVWCEMFYDGAQLIVTVPMEWLDKAKYPVVVDPYIGYDTIGARNFPTYLIGFAQYSMPTLDEPAIFVSMSAALAGWPLDVAFNARGAFFSGDGSITSNADWKKFNPRLWAQTSLITDTALGTMEYVWYTANFSTPPAVPTEPFDAYVLAIWSDMDQTVPEHIYVAYDEAPSLSGSLIYDWDSHSGQYPSEIDITTNSHNVKYSVYLSYIEGVAPPVEPEQPWAPSGVYSAPNPPYLFYDQGLATMVDLVWTEDLEAFTDSPGTDFFWWSDDQAKAIAAISARYEATTPIFDEYAIGAVNWIDTLEYDGMVIRRRVDPLYPRVESIDVDNFDVHQNFIFRVNGTLEATDATDVLGSNFIFNPSVEFGAASPDAWFTDTGAWSQAQAHTGASSLYLDPAGGNMEWRCANFSVEPNHEYNVSMWIKGTINDPEMFLTVRWFSDAIGAVFISEVNINLHGDAPYADWTFIEEKLTSPTNALSADVKWRGVAVTSSVYGDDFSMAKVQDSWREIVLRLWYRQSQMEMAWIKGQSIFYELFLTGGASQGIKEWDIEEFVNETSITLYDDDSFEIVQKCWNEYAWVNITYSFTNTTAYLGVRWDVSATDGYTLTSLSVRPAFDQMSGFGTSEGGAGSNPVGYRYVYFPNTTAGTGLDQYVGADNGYDFEDDARTFGWTNEFFIVHIKDIPDIFDRSLAVVVQTLNGSDLVGLVNYEAPDHPEWQKIHHLVMYYDCPDVEGGTNTTFVEMKYTLLNAHRWDVMGEYQQFFTSYTALDTNYANLDISNDHQYGIVVNGLASWYKESGYNLTIAERVWNYYYDMYETTGNGSYMQAFPYGIMGTYKLYEATENETYRTVALDWIEDLLERQQMDPTAYNYGGFREWGGAEYVYLDSTGPAGICLAYVGAAEENTTLLARRILATGSIFIDSDSGALYCYRDEAGTQIDDDINTYKSAMLLPGCAIGINDTLVWRAMSHIFQRTIDDLKNPEIWVTKKGESWGQEINTETQSWSLIAWLTWNTYLYETYGVYIRGFPTNAVIEDVDFSAMPNTITMDIAEWNSDLERNAQLYFFSGDYRVTSMDGAYAMRAIALPFANYNASISPLYKAGSDEWLFYGEEYTATGIYDASVLAHGSVDWRQLPTQVVITLTNDTYPTVIPTGLFKVGFTDGYERYEASYDSILNQWIFISAGEFEDYMADFGTITTVGQDDGSWDVVLTYPIGIGETIADAYNVELEMWSSGRKQIWEDVKTDYFHIYNQGGRALGYGNGSSVTGGDTFEIFAGATEVYQVNQTWRKMQTYHTMLGIRVPTTYVDTAYAEEWFAMFGVNYIIDGVEIEGWYCNITMTDGNVADGLFATNPNRWIALNIQWYQNGVLIKSDELYSFYEPNDKVKCELILDLWFNKANGSRVSGGRIIPRYYGIVDTAFWPWDNNWSPLMTNTTESMYFDEILDGDGVAIPSVHLDLMNLWVRISREHDASPAYDVQLVDYELQDIVTAEGTMRGVDTPTFTETIMPDLPTGGFLASLGRALRNLLVAPLMSAISAIGSGLSNAFIGMMDIVFGWFNLPVSFREVLQTAGGVLTAVFGVFGSISELLLFLINYAPTGVWAVGEYVSLFIKSVLMSVGPITWLVTVIVSVLQGMHGLLMGNAVTIGGVVVDFGVTRGLGWALSGSLGALGQFYGLYGLISVGITMYFITLVPRVGVRMGEEGIFAGLNALVEPVRIMWWIGKITYKVMLIPIIAIKTLWDILPFT